MAILVILAARARATVTQLGHGMAWGSGMHFCRIGRHTSCLLAAHGPVTVMWLPMACPKAWAEVLPCQAHWAAVRGIVGQGAMPHALGCSEGGLIRVCQSKRPARRHLPGGEGHPYDTPAFLQPGVRVMMRGLLLVGDGGRVGHFVAAGQGM